MYNYLLKTTGTTVMKKYWADEKRKVEKELQQIEEAARMIVNA